MPRNKASRLSSRTPLGVRDLHLHWNLPFLQSEISNLKFEISSAFALVPALAHCSTLSATSVAAEVLFCNFTRSLQKTRATLLNFGHIDLIPVCGDCFLRIGQIHCAAADLLVQIILDLVFIVRASVRN
jgi:hypothetical protein